MQDSMAPKTEDKVSLSVRVTSEEMEIIKRVADLNCRTVSDQIRFMIKGISEESKR